MENNNQVLAEQEKPKFSWTPEQQEAIEDRGHNLLVSASAGSGKTTVMIQRIVDLMLEQEIPISKFLVVVTLSSSLQFREERSI